MSRCTPVCLLALGCTAQHPANEVGTRVVAPADKRCEAPRDVDPSRPLSPSAALCLLASQPEDWSAPVTLAGTVVRTNLASAPECAVHRTGLMDPFDCRSPIPIFWIADEIDSPEDEWIPVMGWASNFANVYEALVTRAYEDPEYVLVDGVWGAQTPPFSIGSEVLVRGEYSRQFALSSSNLIEHPRSGVVTYQDLEELKKGSSPLTLPGVRLNLRPPDQNGPEHAWPLEFAEGPYSSLSEFCAQKARGACSVVPRDQEEADSTQPLPAKLDENPDDLLLGEELELPPDASFMQVRTFQMEFGPRKSELVGLRTPEGWFVFDPGWSTNDADPDWDLGSAILEKMRYESFSEADFSLVAFDVSLSRQVPGPSDPDAARFEGADVTDEGICEDDEAPVPTEQPPLLTREVVVCTLLAGAPKPACSSSLITGEAHGSVADEHHYELLPTFDQRGRLHLQPLLGGAKLPEQVGVHVLTAPSGEAGNTVESRD